MSTTLSCPFCGSLNVTPSRISHGYQLYKCADCGKEFPNPVIIDALKQATDTTANTAADSKS